MKSLLQRKVGQPREDSVQGWQMDTFFCTKNQIEGRLMGLGVLQGDSSSQYYCLVARRGRWRERRRAKFAKYSTSGTEKMERA